MNINIKNILEKVPSDSLNKENFQFSNIILDPSKIKSILINEVVPSDPDNDFYSNNKTPDYLITAIPLFQKAEIPVNSIKEILSLGIYITNAVKIPKTEYTIPKSTIEESLIFLEKEIDLFPNLKVIMLMGDVAKKSFNLITKNKIKRNIIPAVSTYKLRDTEIYYGKIRVLPSYIITGKNILIEKSKYEMASEDIKKMMSIIK